MKDRHRDGLAAVGVVAAELELSKLIERTRLPQRVCSSRWGVPCRLGGVEIHRNSGSKRAGRRQRTSRAFAAFRSTRRHQRPQLFSGALAGLAGASKSRARTSYVTLDMSPGYGYPHRGRDAGGRLHPLCGAGGAIFIAGMFVGADIR